jgi:hypothetical protein
MEIIDVSDNAYSFRHGRYGGQAGDKDGIIIDGENWIVKYPKSTRSMEGTNINLMEIFDIVKNTPSISDIRKEFYITIINERYNQLLLEPYIHLMYNLEYNEINNMDKQIIKNSLQNKNELSFDKFLQIRAVER